MFATLGDELTVFISLHLDFIHVLHRERSKNNRVLPGVKSNSQGLTLTLHPPRNTWTVTFHLTLYAATTITIACNQRLGYSMMLSIATISPKLIEQCAIWTHRRDFQDSSFSILFRDWNSTKLIRFPCVNVLLKCFT